MTHPPYTTVSLAKRSKGRQGVTAKEADHVAQAHVGYWAAEGMSADEMIQAVTGTKFVTGYDMDAARAVVASSWRQLIGEEPPPLPAIDLRGKLAEVIRRPLPGERKKR